MNVTSCLLDTSPKADGHDWYGTKQEMKFTQLNLLQVSQCSLRSSCGELSFWDDYFSRYDIWTLYVACLVHILFYFLLLRYVDVRKDGGSSGEALRVAMFMQSAGKRDIVAGPQGGNKVKLHFDLSFGLKNWNEITFFS